MGGFPSTLGKPLALDAPSGLGEFGMELLGVGLEDGEIHHVSLPGSRRHPEVGPGACSTRPDSAWRYATPVSVMA
jgi:hypothetical protein